ncbi:MAG: dihydrolipoyl dehydrogenase [Myxococcota bacterium]|jgi:dihydrolipoamide dehydrogenase
MTDAFDVVFIGGGPGGYHAAIYAAKNGLKAAVVERAELGGTCLNRGCIPTKVIHASAEAMHSAHEGAKFGFVLEGTVRPDYPAVAARKDAIVKKLRDGITGLFRGNGITLFPGTGMVIEGGVRVTGPDGGVVELSAKDVVVTTGSRPSSLPGINVDHEVVIDSDDALAMASLPATLLVIGGGVIGCEFADMYSRFGTKVTIVELLPRIIATEDPISSRSVAKSFASRGIEVVTGVSVSSVERIGDAARVTLSNGKSYEARKVLVSVGRRPNTAGLGLDDCLDQKGFIRVDATMKTPRQGVWAAGDCIAGPMLAHVASREAETAVENMLGRTSHMNYDAIPGCVFTSPEVASVGVSEDAAKQRGIEVKIGKFFYQANGQALALGDEEGQVKVVAEKSTGRLLGATVIGKGASSLIAELALAVSHGMKAKDVYETVHAHPTLAEISMEAVADVDGMAIHKVTPRKK